MMLESGASNLFFLIKNNGKLELITHPLDGCILPGITWDSIINLVPEFFPEVKVIERPFKISEFQERHRNGELVEVFMTGTAAVISHVDQITLRGEHYEIEHDRTVSENIKKLITDI